MHTQYANDLAISAVSYDTLLVSEVLALVAPRLGAPPTWDDASSHVSPSPLSAGDGVPGASLSDDVSRVVLVLSQRLWGKDETTNAEAAALRDRLRQNPRSVVVVTLDETALPRWMARLRHRSLAALGLDAVAEFVLEAVADAGGTILPKPAPNSSPDSWHVRAGWPDPPTPFLGQTRAHSALRREFDALTATLQARFAVAKARRGDGVWEVHKLPHRVVARLDDVGISFSWLPGRSGAVADGQLMIIEWSDIAVDGGIGAFRTARLARECVYRADASGPDIWCWRVDRPNGRALSTFNLVGEWVAGAAMTTHAPSPAMEHAPAM